MGERSLSVIACVLLDVLLPLSLLTLDRDDIDREGVFLRRAVLEVAKEDDPGPR